MDGLICIDFRPYTSNTAIVSSTIAGATINPSTTLSFNYTPYLPSPNKLFISDLEYYIGRVDRLSVDINGNIKNETVWAWDFAHAWPV